ncbi:amino acid ABC transporter substrate-binding protein, partial [bacterium]|nr:amino acid ABC transporter substrate-binding protein [bacterium]
WTVYRAEDVLFSNAYQDAGQIIIVNASNEDIDGPFALENKTVGVQINSTGETEALAYTGNVSRVIIYGNDTVNFDIAATAALLAGEIDAIVMDNVPGRYLVKNNPDLKVVGDRFTDEYYAVAVKNGETALRDEINKVITDLQSTGQMDALEDEWLS